MTNESFRSLCDKLEQLKQEKAEAAGSTAELLRQLKEKYGASSLKEAKAMAKRLTTKDQSLEVAEDAELTRLKKEFPEQLKEF